MIKISIIIPYYKKFEYIESTIRSILNQSFKDFEILLIDDEISEESFKLLKKITSLDNRIKLIQNKINMGAGISRNNALKKCQGKYIAFCDSDDLWEISKLEKQYNYMENLNLDFTHTSYKILDDKGNELGLRKAKKSLNFKQLLNSCDIGLSSVMIRRKIFLNETFKFGNLNKKRIMFCG